MTPRTPTEAIAGLPLFDESEPSLPPYRRNSETSLAAAANVRPRVAGVRRQVLAAITTYSLGIDEIATRIGKNILMVRPRVSELKEAGLVEITKGGALSQLGHKQAVVSITAAGRQALDDSGDVLEHARTVNASSAAGQTTNAPKVA